MLDISHVTHPEARRFLKIFLSNRAINREFYVLVPDENLDYRMINTADKKSDSVRESLIHQISVQRTYLQAIETGKLILGSYLNEALHEKTKPELLDEIDNCDRELVTVLSQPEVPDKQLTTPWNENPVRAIDMLWGLNNHEILHTGWNIAVMDHLNISRFKLLQQMWG